MHDVSRTSVPPEIAEVAAWRLSHRSSCLTGTVLRVDGGARN
ncbi:NAD(P)-dependent dehydrogenase (short-subunit alcohol dehydrogenase family) [Streptomyces albogriseolus]